MYDGVLYLQLDHTPLLSVILDKILKFLFVLDLKKSFVDPDYRFFQVLVNLIQQPISGKVFVYLIHHQP